MTTAFASPVCPRQSRRQFREDGFLILPDLLSLEDCAALADELTGLFLRQRDSSRRRLGGVRNVLRSSPRAAAIANSPECVSIVTDLSGRAAFPVRAVFFDKTTEANWSVPWHQDLAIAVAGRMETPGFGPWSIKEGVVHVQPPQPVLDDMIALRLHLDDCSAENGALKVISGSHLDGELDTDEIAAWTDRQDSVVCEIPRGGALLMRPMLLHASPAAQSPSHRRVLHIEYASRDLPGGLKWFERS